MLLTYCRAGMICRVGRVRVHSSRGGGSSHIRGGDEGCRLSHRDSCVVSRVHGMGGELGHTRIAVSDRDGRGRVD